jgi:diguanylate cyclase (GGDEF)-like protein
MRGVLDSGVPDALEFSRRGHGDGEETWYHVRLAPDRDALGAIVGLLVSIREITQMKRTEQAHAHQALHDPLTGLANRTLLMDRLEKALVRLERNPGRLALYFIDLDGFKVVNDEHGHEVGDRLLIDVARRLEGIARQDDTVARLGGDEYVVLCDGVPTADIESIAGRLVSTLAESFDVEGASFARSASVGVMVTDDPHASASGLLHAADSAMYCAKLAGRNRFEVFDPSVVIA